MLMRAAVLDRFGPPDVLEIREVAIPEIGPGDILVRVRASAVQPFDVAVRSGWAPPDTRWSLPIITGNEFAGEIVAVGAEVTGLSTGDRVAGRRTFGCVAEYLAVAARDVALLPASLGFPEGAYLGGTGQTAHVAVEFLGVAAQETFLIHGGSGGVGSVAVQLGVLAGARVIATGSPANQDYLRRLGAEPLIYGEGLRDRIARIAPGGVDVVLDCAGGEALDISIALGTDKSRIATLADYQRYQALGVHWPNGERNGVRLARLMALAAAGDLTVHIRRTYAFEAVADAHRDVEAGHGPGKVAVLIP